MLVKQSRETTNSTRQASHLGLPCNAVHIMQLSTESHLVPLVDSALASWSQATKRFGHKSVPDGKPIANMYGTNRVPTIGANDEQIWQTVTSMRVLCNGCAEASLLKCIATSVSAQLAHT